MIRQVTFGFLISMMSSCLQCHSRKMNRYYSQIRQLSNLSSLPHAHEIELNTCILWQNLYCTEHDNAGSPFTGMSLVTFTTNASVARDALSRKCHAALGKCVRRDAQWTSTRTTAVWRPQGCVAIETAGTHLTVNTLGVVSATLHTQTADHTLLSKGKAVRTHLEDKDRGLTKMVIMLKKEDQSCERLARKRSDNSINWYRESGAD